MKSKEEVENVKKGLPRLCKEVKIACLKRDWDTRDLARAVNLSREYVSSVINDRTTAPTAMRSICDALDIAYDDDLYLKKL